MVDHNYHRDRLALAVAKAMEARATGHEIDWSRHLPLPVADENSPDLNVFDIAKHPRWRWHR